MLNSLCFMVTLTHHSTCSQLYPQKMGTTGGTFTDVVRGNREMSTMKALYNKCIAWGFYEGPNPALKVRLRREPKGRERYLEPEEEHRLLAQLSGTLHALVRIAINTGLRVEAELLTLQWPNVDLRQATVTVEAGYSKNGKTRTVPLNSIALEALKTIKVTATSDYVFAKEDGSRMKESVPPFAVLVTEPNYRT